MTWQDIDCAPKDGRRLLLYTPEKLNNVGNRRMLKSPWITIGYWRDFDENVLESNKARTELYRKHGGYWTSHFKGLQPMKGLPSHWMFLPEFPL